MLKLPLPWGGGDATRGQVLHVEIRLTWDRAEGRSPGGPAGGPGMGWGGCWLRVMGFLAYPAFNLITQLVRMGRGMNWLYLCNWILLLWDSGEDCAPLPTSSRILPFLGVGWGAVMLGREW